jgi:TPP-dependent pyruvate/acetoin dehydrogenase alpha subunit
MEGLNRALLDALGAHTAVLDARGILARPEREALRAELRGDVDRRVEAALAAPAPESTAAREAGDVWAPRVGASEPRTTARAKNAGVVKILPGR